MTDIVDIKAKLRKQALVKRKQAFENAQRAQSAYLSEVLAGYRGVPLAGYMPIRTEITPLAAMAEAAAHGRVGVPVIDGAGRPLKFSRWEPDDALKDGPFGAKTPLEDDFFDPEILIVPLVAFDLAGGRLGYGGGYYDRTLQVLRAKQGILAIGFAFGAQQVDELPLEDTDQPLDMIVTENGVLELK